MADHAAIVAEIPRLRRYARALVGSHDGADDLVQDTLEAALAKWHFWQRGRELRPWLFAIMHNRHLDRLRSSKRLDFRGDDLPEVAQAPTQGANLALRDLDRALSALPLDQRAVLLLVGLEELSYAETARVLGLPVGTVMSRLARARSRLRAVLAGEVGTELKVVK